ncbi:odorant binding protein 2 [Halictus rubicundus]|uniref:odorant binding protein 2 n=1 Tax=Halictus rubicundus TaxID=77578 RepID=UPI0040353F9A
MKSVIVVACLLAAVIPVRSIDSDAIIGKYLEYLMPYVQPCLQQLQLSEVQITKVQQQGKVDLRQMGCLKACVMKRLGILVDSQMLLEPMYQIIETLHAGNEADIKEVRGIADTCTAEVKGETDECNIGNKFLDCCFMQLFN